LAYPCPPSDGSPRSSQGVTSPARHGPEDAARASERRRACRSRPLRRRVTCSDPGAELEIRASVGKSIFEVKKARDLGRSASGCRSSGSGRLLPGRRGGRCRGRLGRVRVRRPEVAPAFRTDPELIGPPRVAWQWVPHLHALAASLAAHGVLGCGHASILVLTEGLRPSDSPARFRLRQGFGESSP
jgi:hypothetical protein